LVKAATGMGILWILVGEQSSGDGDFRGGGMVRRPVPHGAAGDAAQCGSGRNNYLHFPFPEKRPFGISMSPYIIKSAGNINYNGLYRNSYDRDQRERAIDCNSALDEHVLRHGLYVRASGARRKGAT